MKKPNIVVIIADDQGAWSLGSAGNDEIITPNLDRMAKDGMRFENFFCVSPVCSPARASILTGLLPSAHGVQDWLRGGNLSKETVDGIKNKDGRYEGENEAVDYLKDYDTYTKQLADNGYICALSGKWHLGDSLTPKQGFSKWYTIGLGGCLYFKPDIIENGTVEMKDEYVTTLITNKTLDYLDEFAQQDAPFYISVTYTAPHTPWDSDNHPDKYLDLYKDCECNSCPKEELHPQQINSSSYARNEEERRAHIRGYYASITAMDEGIGEILDKLEALHLAEDTIVIFTSDNGVSLGHHGTWGKGNSTMPLNLYDTNVKVPFIAYRKGVTPNISVPQGLYSHYDLYETILDYAGVSHKKVELSCGESFANLLHGADEENERNTIFVIDEYGPVRMIRDKHYKYVHRYPYGPHELYDLSKDSDEKYNLYSLETSRPIIDKLENDMSKTFLEKTIPELDATKHPISGKGQLNKINGLTTSSFGHDWHYVKDNNYKLKN